MEKKRLTIDDIAKLANVSKSTVSRVINGTTAVNENKREAVLAAMKELNFRPNVFARGLAGGNSLTVGIVTQNIGSPFYDMVTQGVIQRLVDTDYSPIFVDGQWNAQVEAKVIETLIDRQVDGIISVGGSLPPAALEELRHRVPLVLVARHIENWDKQCVAVDNQRGGYLATRFLLDSGHRRIAHIMGISSHHDAISRVAGYRQALEEAGVGFDPHAGFRRGFQRSIRYPGGRVHALKGNRHDGHLCGQ